MLLLMECSHVAKLLLNLNRFLSSPPTDLMITMDIISNKIYLIFSSMSFPLARTAAAWYMGCPYVPAWGLLAFQGAGTADSQALCTGRPEMGFR